MRERGQASHILGRLEAGELLLNVADLRLHVVERERHRAALVLVSKLDLSVFILLANRAQDALEILALADLLDEAALVEGGAGVQIAKLEDADLAELVHDRVRSIVLDDHLHELHLL